MSATSTKIERNSPCPCRLHVSWVNGEVKVELAAGKKYKQCCRIQPNFKDVLADIELGQELVRQHNEELKSKLSPEQWAKVTTPPAPKRSVRNPLALGLAAAGMMGMCLTPLRRNIR